jgi:hypothetical protein
MITKIKIACLLGCALTFFSVARAEVSAEYRWKRWVLTVSTSTPPGYIYLEDGQGRRVGANPQLPFNEWGGQGNFLAGLEEIPLSSVEQQNIGDDSLTMVNAGKRVGFYAL